MKKYLLLLLSAIVLASCGHDQPVETSISKNDVDITGNVFRSFRLGGEVHLLMAPNHDDDSKWMIRATVPLQKVDDIVFGDLYADLNLLDGNGTKVRDGFSLTAEDLESILPVFNAARDTERTIVFSADNGMKKDFSYKEAAALIQNVKKIRLTINASKPNANGGGNVNGGSVINAPTEQPLEENNLSEGNANLEGNANQAGNANQVGNTAPVKKDPLTLNSLLKDYGVYGLLAQYEKYWKKGDRRKAKEVEDRLFAIERKVSGNNSIPKYLRDKFVEYIENKEDEIEKRY